MCRIRHMKTQIEKIKLKYMDKYGLSEEQANDKLVFCKHNNKLLVGMAFCDKSVQDQNFYLFEADQVDCLYNTPIAQIKFLDDNKPTMFIRRLEFVNDKYKGKGYATSLIKCFEAYCKNNGLEQLTGELIPLHGEQPNKVEKFYLKNGYKISLDQNNQKHISKSIKNLEVVKLGKVRFVDNTKKAEEIVL